MSHHVDTVPTPSPAPSREPHSELLRIGVLGPFTSNREVARLLTGVLQSPSSTGHEIIVVDEPSGAEAPVTVLPDDRPLDGLIILAVPIGADVEQRLVDLDVPAVMVDLDHERLTSVVVDHRGGGFTAGSFLAQRGHERVAYVGHRQEHNFDSQSRQKLEGLTRALPSIPDVYNTDLSLASGLEAGRQMFAQKQPPTAVFTHTDSLAAGVLTAAREAGLDVPGEVNIIGFNNTEIAELLDITTLAQPFEEVGQKAMQLLSEQLAAPGTPHRTVTLQPRLIERSTT